jgi:hypothetical protein
MLLGCGWMGLPWGPGCNKPDFPFLLGIVIKIFGLFPSPCLFWGCHIGNLPTCGLFGCGGFCFGLKGCTECPKILCPEGGPKIGPPPTGPLPVPTPDPNKHEDKPKPCKPKDHKTVTDRQVYCLDSIDLSSAFTFMTSSTWVSTAVTTSASTTVSCETVDFVREGCKVLDESSSTTTVSTTMANSISSETPGPRLHSGSSFTRRR